MRVKHLAVSIIAALFLGICSAGLSAQYSASQQYNITFNIPQQNGFAVAINRVQGNNWQTTDSVDFGTLNFDSTNNIFLSNYYYAVDLGFSGNIENWSVAYDATPIFNADLPPDDMGFNVLDYNINVVFVKQFDDLTGDELAKKNYADANGLIFTSDQLLDGWLRIYYGIATGEPGQDAPGASPITVNKPAGRYTGQVRLTLFESQ